MIVPQQATQSVAALDYAVGLADALLGLDQPIGQALMIPFAMVVSHELLDGTTQTGLAEENHPLQALRLDRSHESLGDGILLGFWGGSIGSELGEVGHDIYFLLFSVPVSCQIQSGNSPETISTSLTHQNVSRSLAIHNRCRYRSLC